MRITDCAHQRDYLGKSAP